MISKEASKITVEGKDAKEWSQKNDSLLSEYASITGETLDAIKK
jgi:hypothetical protein